MPKVIINNAQFNPLSYDDITKPLREQTLAYNQQQENYLKQLEEMKELADLANSPQDAEDYNEYQRQLNVLNSKVDELNRTGKINYNDFYELRRDYINNLSPVLAGMRARADLIKEQRLNNKDGKSIYDKDYSSMRARDVNSSSTYNTYNTDEISKAIMQDVYSSVLSGEQPKSVDEYLANYDKFNNNPEKLQRIKDAIDVGINSGISTALTQQQKNYVDRVKAEASLMKARRSGSGRSSNSSSNTGEVIINPYLSYKTNKAGQTIINTRDDDGKEISVPYNEPDFSELIASMKEQGKTDEEITTKIKELRKESFDNAAYGGSVKEVSLTNDNGDIDDSIHAVINNNDVIGIIDRNGRKRQLSRGSYSSVAEARLLAHGFNVNNSNLNTILNLGTSKDSLNEDYYKEGVEADVKSGSFILNNPDEFDLDTTDKNDVNTLKDIQAILRTYGDYAIRVIPVDVYDKPLKSDGRPKNGSTSKRKYIIEFDDRLDNDISTSLAAKRR